MGRRRSPCGAPTRLPALRLIDIKALKE